MLELEERFVSPVEKAPAEFGSAVAAEVLVRLPAGPSAAYISRKKRNCAQVKPSEAPGGRRRTSSREADVSELGQILPVCTLLTRRIHRERIKVL